MENMKNYTVRYWGFEDENTIAVFRMIEQGATPAEVQAFIDKVNAELEEEEDEI